MHDRDYSPTGDVSDNPVLWRELRRPLMSRKWLRILGSIAGVLLLITYVVLASESDLGDRDTQIGYAFVFHALILLLACVISATAIAQEKEGDTWMLLLITPMSASEIILGKFRGVLRRMFWPMALVVAHFGVFTALQVISFAAFCVVIWVIVTFNVLWIATGILLSLCIRKVTFAVVLNLMLPIAAYAVVPILLLILGEWTRSGDDLSELVLYYLPYFYVGMAIDELPIRGFDDRMYLPFDHYATSTEFLLYVFAAGAVYLTVTGLVIWRTIVHFDGIVGRARQERSG
jgi:ABC-type transport system involved in multi-copper enzyme maturation permease subunit